MLWISGYLVGVIITYSIDYIGFNLLFGKTTKVEIMPFLGLASFWPVTLPIILLLFFCFKLNRLLDKLVDKLRDR